MKTYPTSRSGFTLSELLIVIAIIAVLATMAWSVMRSAQEDARAAATVSRITAIESLMLQVMEDYEVRRLPISNQELESYVTAAGYTGRSVRVRTRNLRRRIIADLIRSELAVWAIDTGQPGPPYPYMQNPDLGVFPTNAGALSPPFNIGFRDWLDANYPGLSGRLAMLEPAGVKAWERYALRPSFVEPSEYLYRILENIEVDGTSGIEALGPSAVADLDDDGNPEVVDAWGRPMEMRILQLEVDAATTDIGQDTYVDVDPTLVNWDIQTRDPATLLAIPEGYEIINAVIPRPIQSFRIQVVSPSLDDRIQ